MQPEARPCRSRAEDRRAGVLDVDLDRPNLARVLDYLVGGGANFAVDRRATRELIAIDPPAADRIRASRTFVGRATRAALAFGHDQFLDLGSGIPAVGGVHSLVRRARADATVVYVDVDPVTVAHTRRLLGAWPGRTGVAHRDLRDVDAVLDDIDVRDRLDLDRPVTVLCTGALQWLPDDAGALHDVFAGYRRALAPGSLLVLSMPHGDLLPSAAVRTAQEAVERVVARLRLRSRDEAAVILSGWDLLSPGLTDVVDWPVTGRTDPLEWHAAVGRNPG